MSDDILNQIAEIDRTLAYIGNAAPTVARAAVLQGVKFLAKQIKADTPVAETDHKAGGGRIIKRGGMKRSVGWSGLKASGAVAKAKAGLDVGKRDRTDASGSHGHLYVHGTALRWTGFVRDRGRGKTSFGLKRTKNKIKFVGAAPSHLPSFLKTTTASNEAAVWNVVIESLQIGIAKSIIKQGL